MNRVRTLARKTRERLTRRNLCWFLKTNVQSWVLQGVVWGLLTVAGVSAVASVVSAKAAAYVVWVGQCVKAAREVNPQPEEVVSDVYTEILPERKSSKHSGIRWTPAGGAFAPILGTLLIDTDRARVEYVVTEFATPWKGRAFRFEKLTGGTDKASESYDVFCSARGPEADTCDCKGFTYKHTCKHIGAVRCGLLANRWV